MAFKKGQQKKGGRAKGTQNKITTTFKQMVMDTLEAIQGHKTANLQAWAEKNPTEFYKIAGKLIPTELNATVKDKIIVVEVPK